MATGGTGDTLAASLLVLAQFKPTIETIRRRLLTQSHWR